MSWWSRDPESVNDREEDNDEDDSEKDHLIHAECSDCKRDVKVTQQQLDREVECKDCHSDITVKGSQSKCHCCSETHYETIKCGSCKKIPCDDCIVEISFGDNCKDMFEKLGETYSNVIDLCKDCAGKDFK